MAHIQCGCSNCQTPIFEATWHEGKRLLLVKCPECGSNMQYYLDAIFEALGVMPELYDKILENFKPVGRPN